MVTPRLVLEQLGRADQPMTGAAIAVAPGKRSDFRMAPAWDASCGGEMIWIVASIMAATRPRG